jgi:hypothetical protein
LRSRLSRRRSRSEVPPHIPNASLLLSAYSRHSDLTGHSAHIARAAFEDPPRSGKNIASERRIGSSAHLASTCQSTGVSGITSLSVPQLGGSMVDSTYLSGVGEWRMIEATGVIDTEGRSERARSNVEGRNQGPSTQVGRPPALEAPRADSGSGPDNSFGAAADSWHLLDAALGGDFLRVLVPFP